MKLNIQNTETGQQKTFTIDDEHKVQPFVDKRMGQEVEGDCLGDEFKGYRFRITGGNDKQGFPMMQGVLRNQRVRLLFKGGMPTYRERRKGMRKRKSVRGCIVGHDLAILNFTIQKKGDSEIEGLTDGQGEKRLQPKRQSKLRKMFNLDSKQDDVKKFQIRREIKSGEGEDEKVKNTKAPKIQRLVTDRTVRRKRFRKNTMIKTIQQNREEKKQWQQNVFRYQQEQKKLRHEQMQKKKQQKKKTVKKN